MLLSNEWFNELLQNAEYTIFIITILKVVNKRYAVYLQTMKILNLKWTSLI